MKALRIIAVICILAFLASPHEAHARQYMWNGYTVHTRLAPVIVHRVFPPYLGMHIYRPEHGGRHSAVNHLPR